MASLGTAVKNRTAGCGVRGWLYRKKKHHREGDCHCVRAGLAAGVCRLRNMCCVSLSILSLQRMFRIRASSRRPWRSGHHHALGLTPTAGSWYEWLDASGVVGTVDEAPSLRNVRRRTISLPKSGEQGPRKEHDLEPNALKNGSFPNTRRLTCQKSSSLGLTRSAPVPPSPLRRRWA